MDDTTSSCSIESCGKPVKRYGLCYSHYMKQWRYGTPTPEHPARWVDIKGQKFGTLTVIARQGQAWLCNCDCGRTRTVSAGDLNRYGDQNTCGHKPAHRTDICTYKAAHSRVRQDRGLAHLHSCVDCGRQARHWSYDHNDPDELMADDLGGIPYSTRISSYSPRCVPCHKKFDLGRQEVGVKLALF